MFEFVSSIMILLEFFLAIGYCVFFLIWYGESSGFEGVILLLTSMLERGGCMEGFCFCCL